VSERLFVIACTEEDIDIQVPPQQCAHSDIDLQYCCRLCGIEMTDDDMWLRAHRAGVWDDSL
jgi:hypothetical protein